MKLLSWNVNGIRAAMSKGFATWLATEQPDLIGLQEVKISDAARAKTEFDLGGYREFWHSAERPGYSGTAVLVREDGPLSSLLSFANGVGDPRFDSEGRVQTLEYPDFFFLNIYFPNANHELSRLAYKQAFNAAFLAYVKKLERKKPVIATGDFNVAHEEIDLARPRENIGSPGFTDEERADMSGFLRAGLVDTFRWQNPDKVQYSWWSYRAGARPRNIGWRIDYFLVSANIKHKIKSSFILDRVMGSDHCPVGIILA